MNIVSNNLKSCAAEQTGGKITVESVHESKDAVNHGTTVTAVFYTDHIDFTPLGDVVESILTLIQGHPDTDFLFTHTKGENTVQLDTRQLREVLEGVPLNTYDVIEWIRGYLQEQYSDSI